MPHGTNYPITWASYILPLTPLSPLHSPPLSAPFPPHLPHPRRAEGTTFPQSSVPHRALLECINKLGHACYQAGVIGHIAVDFVTLQVR